MFEWLGSAARSFAGTGTFCPSVSFCAAKCAPSVGLVSLFFNVCELWKALLLLLLLLLLLMDIIELSLLLLLLLLLRLLLLLLLRLLLLLNVVDLHWNMLLNVGRDVIEVSSSIEGRGWIPVSWKAVVEARLIICLTVSWWINAWTIVSSFVGWSWRGLFMSGEVEVV